MVFLISREILEDYVIEASNEKEAREIFKILTEFKDNSITDLIKQNNVRYQEEITTFKPIMEEEWIIK